MTHDPAAGAIPTQPHRRYNPLCDEWLLVSAERTARPWLGREEMAAPRDLPAYDPTCYLCPGNARVNGIRNPNYDTTFVFTNDFAALMPDEPPALYENGLLRAETESGTCRVVCFRPRHDVTLAQMTPAEVRYVVDVWASESESLGRRYQWVQVFENRGAAMGASNPHPHGQIWAGNALPEQAAKEDRSQLRYLERTGHRLLLDYMAQESRGEREVAADDEWLVVVPFWAAWPYETLVIPRRPVARLPELDDRQRDALSERLIELVRGYDGLFDLQFPYSMGWHQAPFGTDRHDHWQLHAHFYPPLLRASIRKFMVGYELLSEPQRDITAEAAAEQLRASITQAKAVSPQQAG
jgi:UDPglucose--hexose-1-phosphate uridylyltransferase